MLSRRNSIFDTSNDAHARLAHDVLDRVLAVDQLEHRQLFARQPRASDVLHRLFVAQKDRVEVVDLALDEVPLVDAAEAFHQDAVDVEPERGVEREGRQLARRGEGELARRPAQELEDALLRLPHQRLFDLALVDVVHLHQLLPDRLAGAALRLAPLEEQIEILPRHRRHLDEIAAEQELLADAVRQRQLDASLLEADVDAGAVVACD